MTREKLGRTFDEVIDQAIRTDRWGGGGRIAFALSALAIAVRGLWPDEKPTAEPLGKVPPGGLS
jgi:hypothetical protein